MTKRVAFVTGAGRGMGREIAMLLASKSMRVVVTDINFENAEETTSLINEEGLSLIHI